MYAILILIGLLLGGLLGVMVIMAYNVLEAVKTRRVIKKAWEDIERKSNHEGRN